MHTPMGMRAAREQRGQLFGRLRAGKKSERRMGMGSSQCGQGR